MKLRSQLAIAGVLIILLPLATWRYIGEMHDVLRDAGQRELQTWATAIEAVMKNSADFDRGAPSETDIYAEYSTHGITLDGYKHDWSDLVQPPKVYRYADNKSTVLQGMGSGLATVLLKSAVSDSSLFLLFDVQDEKIFFYDPLLGEQQNGDRLQLFVERQGDLKRYLVRAIAPGHLKAFQLLGGEGENSLLLPEPNIRAYWEIKPGGYSIEIELPGLKGINGFGFSLIDSTYKGDTGFDAWIGTVDPIEPKLTGRINFPSKKIESIIASLAPPATRVRLFDQSGWLIADIDRLSELPESSHVINPKNSGLFDALLYRFFSWLMSDELLPETSIYQLEGPALLVDSGLGEHQSWQGRYKNSGEALMGEMRSLQGAASAYLLTERTDESIAVIVNSTLVRLFGVLLLLFSSLLVGLYFYASWISGRIRRLNHATAEALQQDGQIKIDLPGVNASDEIGELSTGISDLLSRLSSYTEYLRKLASRLAHELRTPLAVVSTSLESIDSKKLTASDQVFFQRAEDATVRLQGIIRSMSEATRLEHAVQGAELEVFDLADWLGAVTPLYQSLYPSKQIALSCQKGLSVARTYASAELLQQMLDKIISNAVDFTPDSGRIEVCLQREKKYYFLDIINEGRRLPEAMNNQLFDAMVSHRDSEQKEPHLGLGLYIVRLIVEKHQGMVNIENVEAGRVRVRIKLLTSAE